jgi:hypothetical protein
MTERIRLVREVVRRGPGLSGEVAANYRAIALVSDASSIKRLADISEELAESVYHWEKYCEVFRETQSNWARALALDYTENLMAVAHSELRDKALTLAEGKLTGVWRWLSEGADEATRAVIATRLDEIARIRGAAALAQRAKRLGDLDFGWIYAAIDGALVDVRNAKELSEEQRGVKRALEKFLKIVPRTDAKAWEEIAEKLGSYRWVRKPTEGLRARIAVDEHHFRRALRTEANGVKGFLQEKWFWRSKAWKSREGIFWRHARQRAERLGEDWEPLFIAEPLLTIGGGGKRAGLELYDGAIIIARHFESGERAVEGFLDVAVQIKAEKKISAVKQVSKDILREVELGGLIELRTRDGNRAIRLLQAPDRDDPLRLIVAPELPEAPRLLGLPPGADTVLIPSMLDAQQLDDVAYFLIRAVVEAPR